MAQSVTTSIRLPAAVSRQLKRVSGQLKKGKNGIIVDALKDFFNQRTRDSLKQEAARQSLLAGTSSSPADREWEESLDLDEWKN
ncbi:MAG: hypothetical protein Q7T11_07165 [Deltaproteobacteria bacterium]|nr:hypothetical protein [Deltaproteobacteria bacterium]